MTVKHTNLENLLKDSSSLLIDSSNFIAENYPEELINDVSITYLCIYFDI